jgi:hypothetical protein
MPTFGSWPEAPSDGQLGSAKAAARSRGMSADGREPDRLQTVLGRKKARGGQPKPDSVEVCPGEFAAWPGLG